MKIRPSKLRPLAAMGDPNVAGASAINRFNNPFRETCAFGAVSHARITSIPVECTIASKGMPNNLFTRNE